MAFAARTRAASSAPLANDACSPKSRAQRSTAPTQQSPRQACSPRDTRSTPTPRGSSRKVAEQQGNKSRQASCRPLPADASKSRSNLPGEFRALSHKAQDALSAAQPSGGRACSTAAPKRRASPPARASAMRTQKKLMGGGGSQKAETQSTSVPNESESCTSIVPMLPLRAVEPLPEDMSSRTPTLTPHALTDVVLRKSELLLAELAALGLSDELQDDAGTKECERSNKRMRSLTSEDAFCLKATCSTPTSDAALRCSEHKLSETVEVPVVLLNLFSETLSKYRSMVQCSPSSKTNGIAEHEFAELGAADGLGSTCSSTMYEDGTAGSTTPNTSLSSPRVLTSPSAASCAESTVTLPPAVAKRAAPPAVNRAAPNPSRKTLPATVPKWAQDANKNTGTQSSHFQVYQQLSPRLQSGSLQVPHGTSHVKVEVGGSLQVPHGGSLQMPHATSHVKVEAPLGCRSCTIQQTVTVTSSIHFHA